MKIFVSYTYGDKWQVKQIAEILENGGHILVYDHHITVGHDWKEAQLNAIRECDSFLWLLSSESVKSEWCLWEFAEAVKASKPIIPVLLQRNTSLPLVIQQQPYMDFTEGTTPANVARLMAGVQNPLHIPVDGVSTINVSPRGIPHSVQKAVDEDSSLVFISYTRNDVDFAVHLREQLQEAGFRTWMDIFDIPAGAVWPEAIDKALNQSSVVVGIMSPSSVQSQNVKNEWSWALVYKVRLILLYLEECRIPHRFIDLNFIDFRYDSEAKFAQLKQQLPKPFSATYTSPDSRKPFPLAEPKTTEIVSDELSSSDTDSKPSLADEGRLNESETRNRNRMLEKVDNFWIKGVLENSLHGKTLIDLGMREKRDAVNHPWNTLLKHDAYAEDIQIGMGIASLFDRMSGELLILGQPGSGKTTMLLELGRNLIEYAQADVAQPIPVVFNLSSWADEHKPIADWIVSELNAKYQVPRKVGEAWVSDDKLVLLLDGLDEVSIEYRNDCVDAINAYRAEHGLTKLAVCSRIADYEALKKKFKLEGAVLIQPLSTEQIDTYFAGFGNSLLGVREAINQDTELRELAATPLMLSIMTLAYKGKSIDELVEGTSAEDKRHRLFAAYVERMFDRRANEDLYSKSETIHYLSFLANRLVETSQYLFLIEQMQPSWLSRNDLKRIFNVLIRAVPVIIGTVLIIIIGMTTIINGLILGTVVALLVGSLGSWIVYQSFKLDAKYHNNWIAQLLSTITNVKELDYEMKAAIISGVFGILVGAILGAIANLQNYTNLRDFGVEILTVGIIGGFGAGVITVIISYILGVSDTIEQNEIRPVETLTWSLREAVKQVSHIIVPLLIIAFVLVILASIFQLLKVGILVSIAMVSFISTIVGIIGGLRGTEIELKSRPNQGIHQSSRYSLIATLIGIVFAIIISIPGIYVLGWETSLLMSVYVGIITGLGYGFIYGGSAVLKHIVLRSLLMRTGDIPWNYAKFLDYTETLVLLRKVGGGYIFVHRMLLEYFAELYKSE